MASWNVSGIAPHEPPLRPRAGRMPTVTVAATYGAGGSVIAPAVAKRLGLPFIDRAIPVAVAEEIHEPLEALCDDLDPNERGSARTIPYIGTLLVVSADWRGGGKERTDVLR